ncbi:hypothetical protein BC828DRAFT_382258 [Blastocladiella britannica]|nr:hypothetical protein BC828DRAFT_382258 [Blastocladiella britannica]
MLTTSSAPAPPTTALMSSSASASPASSASLSPMLPALSGTSSMAPPPGFLPKSSTTAYQQQQIMAIPTPSPVTTTLAPLADQLYLNGLVRGAWADTLLCVAAPTFAKVYPVHALMVSRVAALAAALSSTTVAPIGVAPASGVANLALPDDAALEALGFVRGRDFLRRIDLVLPELASDDALGLVLSYIYRDEVPQSMSPALAVSVHAVASALAITPVMQTALHCLASSLSLSTLPQYLPYLTAAPVAPLLSRFLASALTSLAPVGGAAAPIAVDDLVPAFAALPWLALKQLIEQTPLTAAVESSSEASAASNAATAMPPVSMAGHLRFDFAKRVLAARGNPDENVVVTIGKGPVSGVVLVLRSDRRLKKKVWKADL